jgi:hypothetical protein
MIRSNQINCAISPDASGAFALDEPLTGKRYRHSPFNHGKCRIRNLSKVRLTLFWRRASGQTGIDAKARVQQTPNRLLVRS